jgi:hypothetical protein
MTEPLPLLAPCSIAYASPVPWLEESGDIASVSAPPGTMMPPSSAFIASRMR